MFQQSIIPLGKLRIRQQRRSIIDCIEKNQQIVDMRANNKTRIRCLEPSLSAEDQATERLSNASQPLQDWHVWRSAEELETHSSFYTDDNHYSGDGYVKDFSLGLDSESFQREIEDLFSQSPKFIDFDTAVVFISFNCYEPSQDRFIATQMSIDFPLGGMLIPNTIKIICFSMDQIKQISASALLTDGIQLFFCVCYASRVVLLKILNQDKLRRFKRDANGKETEEEEEIDGYSKGCSIATDVLVVVAFLLKFYFSQQTNYHDLDQILNDNYQGSGGEEYIEMVHYADYYMEQYQMYTLIIILNTFNLLNALRIFRIVHWIMLIIERTFYVIGLFMMLLIPCQLGFSFLSCVFVGPYLSKYATLIGGVKQQIITMMGQQDSMSLMRSNYGFTIIWTMGFIIFFAYFFVTASIVAFEDGFDETVNERGYPDDFKQASQWTTEEYIIWMCSWFPQEYLKRLCERLDYHDYEFEELGAADEAPKEEDPDLRSNA